MPAIEPKSGILSGVVLVTVRQTIVLFFLFVASAWASLINGMPFFLDDTSAYVRGPDFAIVHFLGNRFATAWTQERTLNKGKVSSDANPLDAKHVPLTHLTRRQSWPVDQSTTARFSISAM